jgi:hypothetical protein
MRFELTGHCRGRPLIGASVLLAGCSIHVNMVSDRRRQSAKRTQLPRMVCVPLNACMPSGRHHLGAPPVAVCHHKAVMLPYGALITCFPPGGSGSATKVGSLCPTRAGDCHPTRRPKCGSISGPERETVR